MLKDVASGHMRQESLDNVTDGLQLLLGIVMLFVLGAPKSLNREVLVHYRASSVTGDVHV
jgi:hypothetical protein